MKSIVLLLFIIGLIMVLTGYTRQYTICPNPRIEYRYIPRTFYDEQLSSGNVLKQFSGMFEDENPWLKDRSLKEDKVKNYSNFFDK